MPWRLESDEKDDINLLDIDIDNLKNKSST
jgi:hypothetical protein